MKPTLSRELVLNALMMAVWRRKPDSEVIVHSDQGSQYGRANNLTPSMSPRGNCWDKMRWPNRSSVHRKKNGSENASIKPGIWPPADIFDYMKSSITGPGATVTSVVSVRRPLNRPRQTSFVFDGGIGSIKHESYLVFCIRIRHTYQNR